MKIADLIKIVDTFNANTLPGILPPGSLVTPRIASVKIQSVDLPCRHEFCGKTKSSGKTTSYTSSRSFVTNCLTLSDSESDCAGVVVDNSTNDIPCLESVCVGAVIDNLTEDSSRDLPVVLAVGINYGQGPHYLSNRVPICDNTKMRARLGMVLAFLSNNACPAKEVPLKEPFHLVAANFFPWITERDWSLFGFNCLEEATLIHCCGHFSPTDYVRDLMSRIQPDTVVFHGDENAVPYLGGCVSRTILAPIGFEVIFCDNLANGVGISNAIRLRE